MRVFYEKTLNICSAVTKVIVLEIFIKYGLTLLMG